MDSRDHDSHRCDLNIPEETTYDPKLMTTEEGRAYRDACLETVNRGREKGQLWRWLLAI